MSVIGLALKQLPQALLAAGSRAELQPHSSVRLCSLGFSLHSPVCTTETSQWELAQRYPHVVQSHLVLP